MADRTKVVFVEPAGSHSNVFAHYMTIPMLGPLVLGTIAQQAGFDVTILNENLLRRHIQADEIADADVLCLSCMTATVERGKEIARQYRQLRRSSGRPSRSIIGGIHASMIPEDCVQDFDQVFVGEAESKLVDLLEGRITEKIVYGERVENLDAAPIPNFRLLKKWRRVHYWPILTSRGCPYNCTFCSVTEMFGRGYRTKSIDRVMQEVQSCEAGWVFFVDDHFVVNKKRTREFIEAWNARGFRKAWSCQLRAEVSRDVDLVRDMRDAGCRTVYIGFESINPATLKEIRKNQTVEDIRNSIHTFKSHAINVHGMFMFGSDSDTSEVFRHTSDFCRKAGLTSVQYLILTPLPGTVLFKQIEDERRFLHKDWRYYDAMHVVFQPKQLTPSELQQGMIECFEDFYTYTGAVNESVNLLYRTILSAIQKAYRKSYFPSVAPMVVKIFGRSIVKSWLRFNRPYLQYLDDVSR